MSEEEGEKKHKIVDRRRFDAEGAEKADDESRLETSQSGTGADPAAAIVGQGASRSDSKAAEEPGFEMHEAPEEEEITFSSFAISLATQALMQLGHIQPPPGVQVPRDRVAAKQTIDILTMLEKKTKGNLDQDEARLLEEILHQVRIGFVRAA